MNARAGAARILEQVAKGRSLNQVMPVLLENIEGRERALTQELCYGVLRWREELDQWLGKLLSRPDQPLPDLLRALLHVGLYQLAYLRLPDYAAVAETVNASRQLNHARAAGLINAVLRNYLRRQHEFTANELSHPAWWLTQLQTDWPMDWAAIARANNEHAPLWLRVNRRQTQRDIYRQQLQAANLSVAAIPEGLGDALRLETPCDPLQLPEFSNGICSVQDGAAQFAAELLQPQAGERILDACAAPGGKTAHLLERVDCQVTALDYDRDRLKRLKQNLQRLRLTASVKCADATEPATWWEGSPFDAILLDAPCSGSGVIRRHPDIKYLRHAPDIPVLAAQQLKLLTTLWPLLRSGGRLLYATCSVLTAENTDVVNTFLHQCSTAHPQPISLPTGRATAVGWQIFPGESHLDGFFYALLAKH